MPECVRMRFETDSGGAPGDASSAPVGWDSSRVRAAACLAIPVGRLYVGDARHWSLMPGRTGMGRWGSSLVTFRPRADEAGGRPCESETLTGRHVGGRL